MSNNLGEYSKYAFPVMAAALLSSPSASSHEVWEQMSEPNLSAFEISVEEEEWASVPPIKNQSISIFNPKEHYDYQDEDRVNALIIKNINYNIQLRDIAAKIFEYFRNCSLSLSVDYEDEEYQYFIVSIIPKNIDDIDDFLEIKTQFNSGWWKEYKQKALSSIVIGIG